MGIIQGGVNIVGYGMMYSMVVGMGVVAYLFTNIGGQVALTGAKNLGTKVVNR